jgi:hypothetical protein
MKRPPIERIYTVLSRVIREYRLNPHWKSVANLLKVLETNKDYDDISAWICEQLAASEHLTSSCFIAPFMHYIGLPSVAGICQEAYQQVKLNKLTKLNKANGVKHDSKKSKRIKRTKI